MENPDAYMTLEKTWPGWWWVEWMAEALLGGPDGRLGLRLTVHALTLASETESSCFDVGERRGVAIGRF